MISASRTSSRPVQPAAWKKAKKRQLEDDEARTSATPVPEPTKRARTAAPPLRNTNNRLLGLVNESPRTNDLLGISQLLYAAAGVAGATLHPIDRSIGTSSAAFMTTRTTPQKNRFHDSIDIEISPGSQFDDVDVYDSGDDEYADFLDDEGEEVPDDEEEELDDWLTGLARREMAGEPDIDELESEEDGMYGV